MRRSKQEVTNSSLSLWPVASLQPVVSVPMPSPCCPPPHFGITLQGKGSGKKNQGNLHCILKYAENH